VLSPRRPGSYRGSPAPVGDLARIGWCQRVPAGASGCQRVPAGDGRPRQARRRCGLRRAPAGGRFSAWWPGGHGAQPRPRAPATLARPAGTPPGRRWGLRCPHGRAAGQGPPLVRGSPAGDWSGWRSNRA